MSGTVRLHEWEGRTIDEWRARWRVPALLALQETPSTNDIARRMAEQGAPAGLLVMTEHQTAGRGRMQRPWTDHPGRSLLLSVLLRPDAAHEHTADAAPGTAPLRVGIAVARALNAAAGVRALVKWPNDVVTEHGKLAGILCEAASAGGESVIIAGIGINVLQHADEWPDELRGHAVSVRQAAAAAGHPPPDRAAIMTAVIDAVRPLFTHPLRRLDGEELRAHATIDALRGLAVSVTGPVRLRGTAAGIAADGALLLETTDGIRRVTSGTVRVTAPITHTTAGKPR